MTSPPPGEASSPPPPSLRPPSSRLTSLIIPSLDRIIKSSSRKHSKLASQCKSLIENFPSPHLTPFSPTSPHSSLSGPLDDYSIADSELILSPLLAAASSGFLKIANPALDCLKNLIAHGHLHGEVDSDSESPPDVKLLLRVIESVCKCVEHGDAAAELLVLRTLLLAVNSTTLRIHGDCLLRIVRTCYDLCLGSKTAVNQTTAKASLIQILVIVFGRMEADSSTVPVQPIVVAELMEPEEKEGGPGQVDVNMLQFVQGFVTKIINGIDVMLNPGKPRGGGGWAMHDGTFSSTAVGNTNPTDLLDSTDRDMLDAKCWEISMYKTALEGRKGELEVDGEGDEDLGVQIGSKMRRDAFLVFRALCKLSMKSSPKESLSDPAQMRGKIVALELLKILLENAGAVFRTSERFLGAIKQYLCLSLLKNSASPLMIVFQLSCSIFMSLVSRFRSGLKAEIGVFFPMIILRVLENVAQPNFQQKMIVLHFLEKLHVDSQILVDVFTNYDCDANSSNIFERIVTGLLKTAQGASPGVAATLLPPQEASMKLEAMKCLVEILKSMGDWMNKQLQIPDPQSTQKIDAFEDSIDGRTDVPVANGNTETSEGLESKSDAASGASDAASIEQHRDSKLELEEGISLFNCNPKGGVDFLIAAKKLGKSPDEIATFLRNTSGLNKTFIGDYLGEREEMSLKVMHAYVDSFNFQGMDFDDAIRLFLQDFALPGDEQKIDRIMEKFAEHYCKCNPKVFSSADTAYVLVYSVIMLNTDAHNSMVKNKMTADDFIRNNHGIDGGRDLPKEYMRTLYGRILKNEIKMKEDGLNPQHNHSTNYPKIPGLDSILNIVIQKREDKCTTSDDLIWPMQQFKEKACKSESAYYPATDVGILRFMIEVCWAPMLAAFSVPLDQSDDEVVISLCLAGFHHAIHVTAVMCMKTHRDAFVTSLAKFTSLHSAADMKQKNIDAIKAIVTVAVEDGNYLQEAWEHILTCISRFEHLHLLGEGVPPDAAYALPQINTQKSKQMKSSILPVLKKKGYRQIQHSASGVRRGSYDSDGAGGRASGLVTSEQVNKLVSNLNMLEQIGPSEVNQIFTRSQKLNSEAVIAFVRALCKVSMEELQSTSDPRVFSLTKIVEIAHYNMNRIRLVWSSMWHVLTGFFVTIGCSENLSIAIFAMDSLHQLSMKFLEREELTNYNFQNEFMKPFVIVMRKSKAVEIRELIIRCIFQMIWTHVKYVKSGWKSMFMVFSTASYDEHKYIVLLAFEIIEKIVRDYFPFLTETDTTTFTDFVNCLIAFTNTKFNKDIGLNALAHFQFCALKLADEEVKKTARNKDKEDSRKIIQSSHVENNGRPVCPQLSDKGQHLYFWFPLLAGLSELTFDLRPEIRKGAMEILFDTLRYHGHLFSLPLWERVFDSVLFPIFDYFCHAIDPSGGYVQGFENHVNEDQDAWLYETCTLALQLVIDLFVNFYDTVNPLLRRVLTLLTSFISRPHQNLAGIGIAAFVHLVSNAGSLFSEEKWPEVVSSLKEAAIATLPDFSQIENLSSDVAMLNTENDAAEYQRSRKLYFAISDAKCRSSVQLLLIQAVMEIYNIHRPQLSMRNTLILFQALNAVATHAQEINSDNHLRSRLQDLRSMTQMQDPPLLRLENESFQICLTLLRNGITDQPSNDEEVEVEEHLVNLCREVIQFYLNTAKSSLHAGPDSSAQPANLWLIPLGSTKRRELASRAPLIVATIQAICGLGVSSFQKNLAHFFPLITGLINCEHGSNEVQVALSNMLVTCVGPALRCSC